VTALVGVFLAHSLVCAVVCHRLLRADIADRTPVPGYRMELVRSGIKLAGAAGATAVATRGPLLVLGIAGSAVAVAGYSAGLRFADAIYLLAITAGQALLPSIAAILASDAARAVRLVRRAIAIATAGGALFALAVAPFGSDITRIVFGNQYASSGPLMSVMMAGVPFMGMFWISWFALCAYERERDILRAAIACSAAAVVAAIVVVPAEGATGAAWVYAGALALLGLATYAVFEHHARATGSARAGWTA
jgi:O-antigen/teichoic acid export membrane protein